MPSSRLSSRNNREYYTTRSSSRDFEWLPSLRNSSLILPGIGGFRNSSLMLPGNGSLKNSAVTLAVSEKKQVKPRSPSHQRSETTKTKKSTPPARQSKSKVRISPPTQRESRVSVPASRKSRVKPIVTVTVEPSSSEESKSTEIGEEEEEGELEPGPWSEWCPDSSLKYFWRGRYLPDGTPDYEFTPGSYSAFSKKICSVQNSGGACLDPSAFMGPPPVVNEDAAPLPVQPPPPRSSRSRITNMRASQQNMRVSRSQLDVIPEQQRHHHQRKHQHQYQLQQPQQRIIPPRLSTGRESSLLCSSGNNLAVPVPAVHVIDTSLQEPQQQQQAKHLKPILKQQKQKTPPPQPPQPPRMSMAEISKASKKLHKKVRSEKQVKLFSDQKRVKGWLNKVEPSDYESTELMTAWSSQLGGFEDEYY